MITWFYDPSMNAFINDVWKGKKKSTFKNRPYFFRFGILSSADCARLENNQVLTFIVQ